MQKSQMSKSSTSSRGSVLERTIDELYRDGPERADAVVFGREVGATRRDFVGGAGLAAMSAAVGGARPAPPTCPADGRLRLSEQHSLGASRAAGRKPHVLTFRLPNALKRTLVSRIDLFQAAVSECGLSEYMLRAAFGTAASAPCRCFA